jgi:hypothetical protein
MSLTMPSWLETQPCKSDGSANVENEARKMKNVQYVVSSRSKRILQNVDSFRIYILLGLYTIWSGLLCSRYSLHTIYTKYPI